MYDLRKECAAYVERTHGKESVSEFLRLYDDINSGTPVSFVEAGAVIGIVGIVKRDMKSRTLMTRLFSNKEEK